MASIYNCNLEPDEAAILKELRYTIAQSGLGVTLQGNRLTVRWRREDTLVDVHLIVASVTTPDESRKARDIGHIETRVWRQHEGEAAEIHRIETGEYPK